MKEFIEVWTGWRINDWDDLMDGRAGSEFVDDCDEIVSWLELETVVPKLLGSSTFCSVSRSWAYCSTFCSSGTVICFVFIWRIKLPHEPPP